MRGIISYGVHIPYNRLARTAIGEALGSGGGRGTRAVASYDEDTTTMAVEAARLARRARPDVEVDDVWFATSSPAYLDKTNACAVHAALRLDSSTGAADMGGAVRSGLATLVAGLGGEGTILVAAADIRTGLPGSADERDGGDGAAAFVVGETGGPVLAELIGRGAATEEFLDRWRLPGEPRSQQWEERFGEGKYAALVKQAWASALDAASIAPDQVDRAVVTGSHTRAVRSAGRKLGLAEGALVDDLSASVGNTGAAHAGILLASALDTAEPGQIIAVVVLSDGADVLVFRTGDAIADWQPQRPVVAQVAAGSDALPYTKFLSWRDMLTVEPPRRPTPQRPSASAAGRSEGWKYGFVGGKDRSSGMVHLPPQRKSEKGSALDEMDPAPMADVPATVVTSTVDRVSYSPSPPIVAAVIDFDGGGRMPVELTDVAADEIAIGDRVEMTFRRLYTTFGIHNYFWKARPIRVEG